MASVGEQCRRLTAVVWIVVLAICCATRPAAAQVVGGRTIPSQGYFLSFRDYYDGEFDRAERDFRRESRSAIRGVNGLWIDSICFHTMLGESLYHMGRPIEALERYEMALDLLLAYPDWLIRVQFVPPNIQPAPPGRIRAIPWGRANRPSRLGIVPSTSLYASGQLDQERVLRQGGAMQLPRLVALDPEEIIRCTAIALRRRAELRGVTAADDDKTRGIVAVLGRPIAAANHWSESWVDLLRGLAYLGQRKTIEARTHLERSVALAGEYDHSLTALVLIELGRLAVSEGRYEDAAGLFSEATYSAFHYEQIDFLTEAFVAWSSVHQVLHPDVPLAALEPASAWARVKGYRHLQATLLSLAADGFATAGNPQRAANLLRETQSVMGNRAMGSGRLGVRSQFVAANVAYQQANREAGDKLLAKAISAWQSMSPGLFQLRLAGEMYTQGAVAPRRSMEHFSTLLADPGNAQWSSDPLESLCLLATPHARSFDHWFQVALARREERMALEIADRARRHRFQSSVVLGGRLLALRWVLEAPIDTLNEEARLKRQELLVRYPGYASASQRAAQLRDRLAQKRLIADSAEETRTQLQLLGDLQDVSDQQETILRQIAVARQPCPMAFPPLVPAERIQKGLGAKTKLIMFHITSGQLYLLAVSADEVLVWNAGTAAAVQRRLTKLLRTMGHVDGNRAVDQEVLNDPAWVEASRSFWSELLSDSKADLPGDSDELVIVPDGALWYAPLAAMVTDESAEPLIARVRLRWAPTAGLAVSDRGGPALGGATGVVVGKLFPRDDEQTALDAFDELSQSVPRAEQIAGQLPAPSSVFTAQMNRLIVYNDVPPPKRFALDVAPASLDRNTPGNSLADWLGLPFAGPRQLLLPGFHSAAENSLKRVSSEEAGVDLFLTTCAMMASGTRTALVSQWRTGGQTSFDLVREFAQELPHAAASDAWQRSVLLTQAQEINPDLEPRVDGDEELGAMTASHPFFWAGYVLIDGGAKPEHLEGDVALEAAP